MFPTGLFNDCKSVTYLSKSEMIKIHGEWLKRFCSRVKAATGKWKIDEYMWSGFAHNVQPNFHGTKAIELYRKQVPTTLYIFDESGKHGVICKSEKLPEAFNQGVDIYIMPKDGVWIMVFRHDNIVYFAFSDEQL